VNKEIKSLYRIYRPKNFDEVIGQKHITQTLQNQIKNNTVAHAYLFCGTRGTGKTTVAKIFANEVNGKGNFAVDTFEIDAASNNSVQDVRDIIERVKFPPVASKYKVYIIDEVHMFSGAAFNAFLKTLEEPPAHAIFILCTTEPHKLLPTIQSRCLRFDFRSVSLADNEKLITSVLKKEKINATPAAIKMLAIAGSGSFRDALSFTETAASYCMGREITEQDVTEILGTVPTSILKTLLDQIKKSDITGITKTIDEIFSRGINTGILIKNFIEVIKESFMTDPKSYAKTLKLFCELELTIKNSLDPKSHFENTAFLASIKD